MNLGGSDEDASIEALADEGSADLPAGQV